MNIARFIEEEEIILVESLFSDLVYEGTEEPVLAVSSKTGKILLDTDDNPLLFALPGEDGIWRAACTHLRDPGLALIKRFEEMDCEIYQEERAAFSDAIREYYSKKLVEESKLAMDDYNPDRYTIVAGLVNKYAGDLNGQICLDCCCGSGIGSIALRDAGLIPLACDNDDSLLALGLAKGRLEPGRTMWIDARLIAHYLDEPVPLTCGFMFGEIQSFNASLWREIVTAVCSVSDRILLTTGTREEGEMVQAWAADAGKEVTLTEQTADPIYDRWVITGQ